MLNVMRHKEVFDPEKFDCPVHVVGCGGMGSRVAEGLVRMGLGIKNHNQITLYDFDHFEPHNLANQWVTDQLLSWNKADAVTMQMLEVNPHATVSSYPYRINGYLPLTGVVFLCLDTMADRRLVMEEVVLKNRSVSCVIETRMDAGVGITHCFNPQNKKQLECWRMYWHSDREAENIAGCGGPQSIISAIYGTTAMALKQFERFARTRNTVGMYNRVYQDFEECIINRESWPIN